jgi:hypothetical protein
MIAAVDWTCVCGIRVLAYGTHHCGVQRPELWPAIRARIGQGPELEQALAALRESVATAVLLRQLNERLLDSNMRLREELECARAALGMVAW